MAWLALRIGEAWDRERRLALPEVWAASLYNVMTLTEQVDEWEIAPFRCLHHVTVREVVGHL